MATFGLDGSAAVVQSCVRLFHWENEAYRAWNPQEIGTGKSCFMKYSFIQNMFVYALRSTSEESSKRYVDKSSHFQMAYFEFYWEKCIGGSQYKYDVYTEGQEFQKCRGHHMFKPLSRNPFHPSIILC